MKPLTLTQSAEIAAFAEAYALERFDIQVTVTIQRREKQIPDFAALGMIGIIGIGGSFGLVGWLL